jgi:hypothetical protein
MGKSSLLDPSSQIKEQMMVFHLRPRTSYKLHILLVINTLYKRMVTTFYVPGPNISLVLVITLEFLDKYEIWLCNCCTCFDIATKAQDPLQSLGLAFKYNKLKVFHQTKLAWAPQWSHYIAIY